MPEKEIIIVGAGEINTTENQTGTISANVEQFSGTLEAVVADDNSLAAINSLSGVVNTLVSDDSFQGSLSALDVHNGAASGTLTLRIGQDGKDGKDGFSPTISVYKDTKTEYILEITNKDGSYLTPNLYPDIEGLQDVEEMVRNKVNVNLSTYETIELTHLNETQREKSFIYVNSYDNKPKKAAVSLVALKPEVEDRLRTKIRTVDERPTSDWRLGDYIFLDIDQEDGE